MCAIAIVSGCGLIESGKCGEESLLGVVKKTFKSSWDEVLALCTNEVWGGTLEEFEELLVQPGNLSRILEVRVYSVECELHAVRDALGAEIAWRLLCDGEGTEPMDYFDEVQYLDIDSSGEKGTSDDGRTYRSMNGGSYRLPVKGAYRIRVRNYLTYDEEGLAHVSDYRIVELLTKEA